MPRPTNSTTIQRPDLAAIAYEYMLEASRRGFIGLEILPIFEVDEQSADYPVIPIEAILKLQSTKRAPSGSYPRSAYEFETDTYACEENGWEERVDDVEAKLYRRFFDAEEVATKRAVDIILRGQEKRIAAKVFNTGNFANAAVLTTWSTADTCTPRSDVNSAKAAMRAASGLEPNVLAMSKKVFDNLLMTSEITDALRYTNPIELGGYEVQRRLLAQYFGVSQILVGGAIYDASKKNIAMSITDIWDDDYVGLFAVSNGGPDLKEPIVGRTFLWIEDSPQNLVTESYREEQTRADIIRVRQYTDEEFVFTGAGYLLTGITD
ncbi:MAG: major capsid protein [Deltaproteobacteria bacterium]|nr:major capsid protein [Deltaproteobacteria bacterium]